MTTVDPAELKHFGAAAAIWWDETGIARWLHRMTPVRIDYVCGLAKQVFPTLAHGRLDGLRILDLGCGAGVLSEPLAKRGADVVGVDPAPELISAAQAHAAGSGLAIDYRAVTPEALVATGERFDVVLALDVAEHVADSALFLLICAALVRPGGLLVVSTMNRTVRAFFETIIMAEWVLRFLPRGSHHWRKFVTPDEVERVVAPLGFRRLDLSGMTMDLRTWRLTMSRNPSVTYFMAFRREG